MTLMTNNDVLRRIRYILDLGDDAMIAVFALAGRQVTRAEVSDWLKKEGDPAFCEHRDADLACFLDGLIVAKRGPAPGGPRPPETRTDNNVILMKLKIAFALSGDDMVEIIGSAGLRMSKHEISALLRKPGHKHYRECMDQVLRNLLKGLQLRYRPGATSGSA
jgi:uncharacterized protein YehS (DUF1456 family)